MSGYPKHLYRSPGPYGVGERSYRIAGADDEAHEAALLASGWKATKEEAWGEEAPEADNVEEDAEDTPHPLDHDGDGKKGGSLPGKKRGRPRKVTAND